MKKKLFILSFAGLLVFVGLYAKRKFYAPKHQPENVETIVNELKNYFASKYSEDSIGDSVANVRDRLSLREIEISKLLEGDNPIHSIAAGQVVYIGVENFTNGVNELKKIMEELPNAFGSSESVHMDEDSCICFFLRMPSGTSYRLNRIGEVHRGWSTMEGDVMKDKKPRLISYQDSIKNYQHKLSGATDMKDIQTIESDITEFLDDIQWTMDKIIYARLSVKLMLTTKDAQFCR